MLSKIFTYSIYSILGIAFLSLMGFVEYRNENRNINSVKVEIGDFEDYKFIDEKLVYSNLIKIYDSIEFRNRKDIDLKKIESTLSQLSSVRKADAFFNIEGSLQINLIQKHPIARVIESNKSYYLDENGEIMPLQKSYSSAVIVVFVEEAGKLDRKAIYSLIKKIENSEFLKTQIAALNVSSNGKVTMETIKGKHYVELGKPVDLDKKLEKLITYYEYTVSEFGWDSYKKINLEFANQVVCTK